jgi:hypothetical protein
MERARLHHDVDASFDAWVHDAASSGVRPVRAADHRYRHRELRHRDRHQGHRDDRRNRRRDHPDDRRNRHRDRRDDQHLHRAHRDDRRTQDAHHRGRTGADYRDHDRGQPEPDAPWACRHQGAEEWDDPWATTEFHHLEAAGSVDRWETWDDQAADQPDVEELVRGEQPRLRGPREPEGGPAADQPVVAACQPGEPERPSLHRDRWR